MQRESIHCLSSYYSSMEHSAVAKGTISPYTSKSGHYLYPLLESRHWGLSLILTGVSLVTRFCSSYYLVVILDSYSHLGFYLLIPKITGSDSWDLDFYFLQDDRQTPFRTQMTPWKPRQILSSPRSWCQMGASLPHSSSRVSLETCGNCWKKPLFVAPVCCRALVLCVGIDLGQGWTSRHLLHQHNWCNCIPELREIFKYLLSWQNCGNKILSFRNQEMLYFKAKLCYNKRMVWASGKNVFSLLIHSQGILRHKDHILISCAILGYQVYWGQGVSLDPRVVFLRQE